MQFGLADFGDFVDVETTMSSWREKAALCETNFCGAFDLSTTEYVDDILWGYLHLQGVSQDNAIWYFLDEIRHIPRYGIRTFRGTTSRNEPAELGVSRNGVTITTLETQQRTIANLKWEHIKDLTYSRKTFTIQMLKKNKSVHFIFEDLENARYLWQFCIQMHSCYIEYWTRIKSLPQQPAVHISEPPDILRGTELRHPSPESPMPNEVFPDTLQFSPVSRPSPRSPLQLVRAPHKEMYHVPVGQTSVGSQPRPFKIDPSSIIKSANLSNDDQRARSAFATDSKPNECAQNLALLTAVHEGVAESESSTLVGQWSLRSAADTLDSQMLNQGCVTCLPGREWLHPAGWFQPRVHNPSNLLNTNSKSTNSNITKHGRSQDKSKQTKVAKRARPHHHSHHRRHQEEQPEDKQPRLLTAPEHTNSSARKHSQTGLTCSQNLYLKPRAASTGQVHDNIVLHLSHADRALMENRPSSPTSMGRQQAAVDAVLHEQQHLDDTGEQTPFANMTARTEPSSKETNRKHSGNKPLHEFQRWLLEAKQRFPVTWANTMINGRRMTLQISVPVTDPNDDKGVGLKSHHRSFHLQYPCIFPHFTVSRPSPRSPLQLVRAPHKEMYHVPVGQTSVGSQPRPFKIDPSSIIKSANLSNDDQRARSAFATDSKPNECAQNLALLTAVHEGVAESESSTLVGQWSLRSAADTLDSQMLNQGCVTCLPGREWLHPAGWFQPRVHNPSNLLNTNSKSTNSNITKHGRSQDKSKQTKVAKRARPHHHSHHRRHQEEQPEDKQPRLLTAPEHTNSSARKHSQTGLTCSQNLYLKPRAASTGQVHDNIVLHLSHADRALMENRPSSPTSMGSSDSSSEHEIVASRASFSSSSSSCCSESAKKTIVRQCNSGDQSCSSTSSSTSSIHSSLTEQHCADMGVKKSAFAFTAALCTATHNIAASKPNTKLSNSNQTNIVRVTNRKMWLSNAGALRPLLSGLNQRHYRPQVQMKRQQAAVDAVLHEQQHLDDTGEQTPFANMTARTEPSSKETNRKHSGNKPLHEFQRWLLEAKQRFPVTWANTMINGRRMTLQISVPVTDPNDDKGVGLKSHHCGTRMMDKMDISPLAANVATPDRTISDSNQLTPLSTVQAGRLARSSSEACAHQLAGVNPLQFVNQRTNGFVNTPPTPFAVYLNAGSTSDRQIHRQHNQAGSVAQLGRLENTPAIHLYPPSPTQTPHSEESPPALSELNNPDLIWISTVLNQGKQHEAVNIAEQYSEKEACKESTDKLLTPSSDEVGSRQGAYSDRQIANPNGFNTNSVNRDTPLRRQGAFHRKPSSARLIPYPLNLNDANRLAVTPPRHMPDEFTERTVGGIVRNLGPVNGLSDSSQQHLNAPHNLASQDGKVTGFMYTLYKGTETQDSGHFSAPPSTPSGRLHFVWGDTDSPSAQTPVIPQGSSVHPHDMFSNWHRSLAVPNDGTSLNMSHILATASNLPAPDVTLPSANPIENLPSETNPNSTEADLNEKPMTTSLTNSSMSSDQSSSNRPPSNGPLHLLTHSDIHQLLSLTNIRETELAHRLLVEYRQVLLQQQSLHTNSVSTPNLTASQELQMFSSSTAAEDIEDVEVEAAEIAKTKKEKER
ncbi:hypothetical protein AHF37_01901 [Paragonimus kellicotti]|nr:hypothetical protein AHF37_01901 [Paragonimus kellicotti]